MTSPSRRPDPALARAGKQRKRAADPEGLCPRERLFVEAYVLSGGNATKAYQACMAPVIVKASSAASLGWRMLRTVKVRAAIDSRRAERFQALKMEADEALSLIALRAGANLADAYDDTGKLLPFHQWPESLQLACRARCDKDGRIEWQFSDWLFPKSAGTRLGQRNALRAHYGLLKRAGVPKSGFHRLRHTFATSYLQNGGDVVRLSRVLGHAQLTTTMRYLHLVTTDLQKPHQQLSILNRLR